MPMQNAPGVSQSWLEERDRTTMADAVAATRLAVDWTVGAFRSSSRTVAAVPTAEP